MRYLLSALFAGICTAAIIGLLAAIVSWSRSRGTAISILSPQPRLAARISAPKAEKDLWVCTSVVQLTGTALPGVFEVTRGDVQDLHSYEWTTARIKAPPRWKNRDIAGTLVCGYGPRISQKDEVLLSDVHYAVEVETTHLHGNDRPQQARRPLAQRRRDIPRHQGRRDIPRHQ